MKSKSLKKMSLNKRSISALMQDEVTGGKTTVIINVPPPTTFCTTWCADTVDDYSCQCTIA
ncbi:hypothetical protein H2O64_09930 [Kordia sp. YSTF-M3]|uniref:Natural product n=1 Tax=Kordia aestuariivivens TaxID=2759037 RepID=A0ABR7Q8V8_9FLAO|nr:hypothetical protein [Kordia aestuariivivens]MBC8754990.1 hypothetical protein [Kordia aestuariivivens]